MAKKPASDEQKKNSYDPAEIAIYAPPPKPELMHLVGPLDGHDASHPNYDPTFDWIIRERHIKRLDARGSIRRINIGRKKTADGFARWAIDGRHDVLAMRLVNELRDKAGEPRLMVQAGVDEHLTNDDLQYHQMVLNKHYTRTPAQMGRDARHKMATNGWEIKQAAEWYGKSRQTIELWLRRADEEDKGIVRERKTTRRATGLGETRRQRVITLLADIKNGPDAEEAQKISSILAVIDGDMSEMPNCPAVFRRVVEELAGKKNGTKEETI